MFAGPERSQGDGEVQGIRETIDDRVNLWVA
jgi:hypothetical protein